MHLAVFDTGLLSDRTHFPNVVESTDWTGENTTIDAVGHGTFVAGLIAGHNPVCPGIAPQLSLHIFRVFTGAQVSYTSWFLDAFNYALHLNIDILNLSIGGPDFADMPFTDKVNELTAHGIIVISAIGNDGPLWGTLNNPGDMMEVVGVGGAEPDASVAKFSSRGMSTHEISQGYGRVKPDLLAYGRALTAPSHTHPGRCRTLSGTSVASPVVAGAIALLASAVDARLKTRVISPPAVKIALLKSARRLKNTSVYEQGAGLLHITDALEQIRVVERQITASMHRSSLRPRLPHAAMREGLDTVTAQGPDASFFPQFYDLRPEACPHMWPHCAQPLFVGALPLTLNATILNPGGVHGRIERVEWHTATNGHFLRVDVTKPDRFWPWAAGLGFHLSVVRPPNEPIVVEGALKVRVVSVHERLHSDIELPIKAFIIPTPPREKRLLWDMYHSVRYPPGYLPRDSLSQSKDMLDWLGDHPHTNFHMLFRHLLKAGFYIDIANDSFACLSVDFASQYGAILLLDSEDYFSESERAMMEILVKEQGVSLIVAAEWYNVDIMRDVRFEDDNTRSWWSPVMAGGNVPALNMLLSPFGVGLGDAVLSGEVRASPAVFRFESGVPIVKFPRGGELLYTSGLRIHEAKITRPNSFSSGRRVADTPVLGLTKAGKGAVMVYGDTNCIDTAYPGAKCYEFFVEAVKQTITNCAGPRACRKMLRQSMVLHEDLVPSLSPLRRIAAPIPEQTAELFAPHSRVTQEWGNVTFQDFMNLKHLHPICTAREMQRVRARVRYASDTSITLPMQKQVEPVGSENNYYKEMGHVWSFASKASQSNGFENTIGYFLHSKLGSPLRFRSVAAICLGLCLLFASFSIRRKRNKLWRVVRRPLKARQVRGRHSAHVQETVGGRDGAALQALPYLYNTGKLTFHPPDT